MTNLRVLVAASSMLARTGLSALLETEPSFDVIGQVAGDSAKSLVSDITVFRPDVVVLDMDYDAVQKTPIVTTLMSETIPLLLLVPDEDTFTQMISSLFSGTAYGVLLRESDPTLLIGALRAVADGLVVLDPPLAETLTPGFTADFELAAKLTPRETEVLNALARGLPNKTIAQELGISTNTVKFHVNAIMTKLDVQSRTEAVVRATRLGLITL
jgi:DNA-binding NarL/FixJ family response regulator